MVNCYIIVKKNRQEKIRAVYDTSKLISRVLYLAN